MPRTTSRLSDESVRAAEFAFFGTVRRLAASNVSQVEASDDVAIVRADEVVLAPPSVGDIAKRDITVRLSTRAKIGAKALFLASSWIVSDQIALIELARVSGRLDRGALREAIFQEKLRASDDELIARIAVADVVVRGRVSNVSTIEIPPERRHDEDLAWWHLASVEVLGVLKGRPEVTVRVAYLDPRPPRWFDAPVFSEGQEGIWFLRKAESTSELRDAEAVPEGAYSALDPLDYQAAGLFARIDTLTQLSRSRRKARR
jgi:hypothetical protein